MPLKFWSFSSYLLLGSCLNSTTFQNVLRRSETSWANGLPLTSNRTHQCPLDMCRQTAPYVLPYRHPDRVYYRISIKVNQYKGNFSLVQIYLVTLENIVHVPWKYCTLKVTCALRFSRLYAGHRVSRKRNLFRSKCSIDQLNSHPPSVLRPNINNVHGFGSCLAQMFSATRGTVGQLNAWIRKSCVFWDTLAWRTHQYRQTMLYDPWYKVQTQIMMKMAIL